MSYRLKPDRSVADELRRIMRKQLDLAVADVHAEGGEPSPQAVHEARRHVKKARAALRLCRGALGKQYKTSNRRLRRAARLLAPIADREAVGRAFDELARSQASALAPAAVETIRRGLLDLQTATSQQATDRKVPTRAVRQLEKAGRDIRECTIGGDQFDLVAPAFARTLQRGQAAMAKALARPNARRYHAWRRRAKDHWLQVRLLNDRCGGVLSEDASRLAQLDASLGACHDLTMLASLPSVRRAVGRSEAAVVLRLIRRERTKHRQMAAALGAALYAETPQASVQRVALAWRAAEPHDTSGVKRPCLRIA